VSCGNKSSAKMKKTGGEFVSLRPTTKFSFRFGKGVGKARIRRQKLMFRGVGKRIFGGRDGRYMKNPKI